MAAQELVDYSFRQLDANDSTKAFKSGDPEFAPLKGFLKNQALEFQNARIAITYVAVREDAAQPVVIGFITLICSEIDIRNGYEVTDSEHANRYETLPAVKIARLAVDARYREAGLGKQLVDIAIALATDQISSVVGCRFLVTDAKKPAVSFYERNGFTVLDTEENRGNATPIMFLDLKNQG